MHIYVISCKNAINFKDEGTPALLQVLRWLHELGHTFGVIYSCEHKVGDVYLRYRHLDNEEKDIYVVEMFTYDPQRDEPKTIFHWSTVPVKVPWCYGLFERKRAAERLPTKIHVLIDEGAPIQMAVPVADKV